MSIGLSILIPVYNWNVDAFVKALHKQAEKLDISFEILVYDDCSSQQFSANYSELRGVTYKYLEKNIGRSRIRNLLAKDAIYERLLFLDGDSFPQNDEFLSAYWNTYVNSKTILCGGTAYKDLSKNESPLLRWTYGKSREENAKNKKGFASNNFMMDKQTFMDIRFNERIKGYGHEDTLFGIECKKRNLSFQKCLAPLLHLGLESDDLFIRKSEEGVKNLKKLYVEGKIGSADSKLIEFHEKLKLKSILHILLTPFVPIIRTMVITKHNLKAFDVLKWYWFASKVRSE